MRANVLHVMQKANTTLAPLFPYMHPGAMVPTGALIIGGPSVALAQDTTSSDVPLCSKTITDKCMNPTAKNAAHHHKAVKKSRKADAKTGN